MNLIWRLLPVLVKMCNSFAQIIFQRHLLGWKSFITLRTECSDTAISDSLSAGHYRRSAGIRLGTACTIAVLLSDETSLQSSHWNVQTDQHNRASGTSSTNSVTGFTVIDSAFDCSSAAVVSMVSAIGATKSMVDKLRWQLFSKNSLRIAQITLHCN